MSNVHTRFFPLYSWVKPLLTQLDGISREAVSRVFQKLLEQRGTPQEPVDWTNPDAWISERLSGRDAELALRIWEGSGRIVNPRHLSGPQALIDGYALLEPDSQGLYRLTERGRAFLADDQVLHREIDESEGLLFILTALASRPDARPSDLLPEWMQYLSDHSNIRMATTGRSFLWHRLRNLLERGLVERSGGRYAITEAGRRYLRDVGGEEADAKTDVLSVLRRYNQTQRDRLRERLGRMDPYRFEHLVRELLEAIGYDDVQVTKESGDKGVDVVATVQFGITTIREVVQVKRHLGSIGRPVLDQLRGALPYYQALRGTLITLGSFSKGCREAALYPGAAPITLIDGDRLLDLLVEQEIGLKARKLDLWELEAAEGEGRIREDEEEG